MTAILSSKPVPREHRKRYMVGGSSSWHGYADTLAEAKRLGEALAARVAWRGKWNVMFVTVPILKNDAPGSPRYKHTGWKMYVPVRGSGAKADHIVAQIRKRHGVDPMAWTNK